MKFLRFAVAIQFLFLALASAAVPESSVQDLRRCWWIAPRVLSNVGQDVAPESIVNYRKTFQVDDLRDVRELWAVFAGDDSAMLFFNGEEVGATSIGHNPDFTAKFTAVRLPLNLLKAHENVVAVVVKNTPETPSGLIGKITLIANDGTEMSIPMDTTWKWREGEGPDGWMDEGFDDSSWAFAAAQQPNTQGPYSLIGYAPPEPEETFPDFIVPGQENYMALIRRMYNLHFNWFFTCATLWDAWIPRTVAWPAVSDDLEGRPQFQAVRQYLDLREITPEGYVSTHQHYGLGHPKGWPFPIWTQSAGKGWHFALANVPYRDPYGIFLTTTVDDWTVEGGSTIELGEPLGWQLEIDQPLASITSSPISVLKQSVTYVRMEWLAPDLSPQAQPYLEWTTDENPEFSETRRVYFSPPPADSRTPVATMIKLPGDIPLETKLTGLRIGFGNPGPGRITIKAIMTSVETRHNVNNPSYILGLSDYAAWSGDLNLLRTSMPKMRAALAFFLKKYKIREEKMAVTPDIGKDGRSGFGFAADGTKVVTPGRGIGNNYFDILPFGGRDTNATYLIYAALLRMAEMEEQIAAHPEWQIDQGATAFEPADLRTLAAEIKTTAAPYLFNQKTGRFIGAEDLVDKRRWDYGFVFTNNEAIYYDFALPDQALQIRDWLDGKRIVEGDTSQAADIYKYRFGPRMTTLRNLDWYIFPWFRPEDIPWGGQVQDGGSVLGFSYHDMMAILKVRGPDAAWARLREVLNWFKDTQDAGGYIAYYGEKGPNQEGSMQGGGIGNGGLGIMREFQESLLVPQIMIDGFLGLRPRMDGLEIRPALPKDWPSLTITRIGFQGAVYSITAKADGAITVECTAGRLLKPARLFPPEGAWKTGNGKVISPRESTMGIPLPAQIGESLVLTRI